MTCEQCGSRTTRPRLCRDCARDQRRATATEAEAEAEAIVNGPNDPADRVYLCSDCGGEYEADPRGRIECPDCGAALHRCLGPVPEVSAQ